MESANFTFSEFIKNISTHGSVKSSQSVGHIFFQTIIEWNYLASILHIKVDMG